MGNMAYCRFENTSSDLSDCYDHMEDDIEDFSTHEARARKRLIRLCIKIADDYRDEIEDD